VGVQPGDVLDTGDGTFVAEFVETAASTGGARQVVDWTMGRMTRNPVHWHPGMTETFEVLDGELTVEVDGRVRVLGAGDVVVVAPGHRHRFRVEERARWRQTNAPALRHELLFQLDHERALASGSDGRVALAQGLRAFQVMDGYVAGPPVWLQEVLLAVLDRVWPARSSQRWRP
jgi:quercetin dioxygenase-like cupin family protein